MVKVFKVHKVLPGHKEHLKGQPVVKDSKVHKVLPGLKEHHKEHLVDKEYKGLKVKQELLVCQLVLKERKER